MEGSRLCVLLTIFLLNDDLPIDNSKLKRNVTGMFPEQIALAISSPTSMWVSWVTGSFFPDVNFASVLVCAIMGSLMDSLILG
ncbi:hypothetical protein SLEP1_g4517 [Rubroshorea leprosula]|uniref:Uncharacterized protein n=1 Tax=Rubroshorea leprosula TaxID=152421 RepID=A0AAV5HNY1_9ROSI|nr:hypothetical protein SLEP1_g4517 [Rubroshorea leprosula]